MTTTNKSNLTDGNRAFRAGQLPEAIRHYVQSIVNTPELGKIVAGNLALARQKYRASRERLEKQRVAVCGWDLAHNAAGRVYTLAQIYQTFAEVEIIGSLFPESGRKIWEPIRNTAIAKHTFVVEDESRFIEQAIKLVVAHPYDIVHLSKPRAPNIFFGIFYKLIWNAKVLIDIDDEELAFVDEETSISVDDYLEQWGKLPELKDLAGKDWTRLAVGLANSFDGITVTNFALQKRYGGEIIHDENLRNIDSQETFNGVKAKAKNLLIGKNPTSILSETLCIFFRKFNSTLSNAFIDDKHFSMHCENGIRFQVPANSNPTMTYINSAGEFKSRLPETKKKNNDDRKIAVVAHYYYSDIWSEISKRLKAIDKSFDLFVTTPIERGDAAYKDILADFPTARLFIGPSAGMDIVPFLSLIPVLSNEGYEAVCKIHTKKGDSELGHIWRDLMLDSLIGSTSNFNLAVQFIIDNPNVALIGPASLYQSGPRLIYDNKDNLRDLCKQILGCELPESEWGFFVGTMFWSRPKDLMQVSNYINYSCWSEGNEYKKDGKLEHGLERFFGLMVAVKHMKVGLLHFMDIDATKCCINVLEASQHTGRADVSRLLRQYRQLDADYAEIKKSRLFDHEHYLLRYPELKLTKTDLITHYLTHGTFDGAQPNKFFCPDEYRVLNQDIVREHIEPFVHYLKNGAKEKRRYRKDIRLEKDEFSYFRLMVLNTSLIDWRKCERKHSKLGDVSIVIPVYGQPNLLKNCIESIYQSKNRSTFELILVDNRHDDETSTLLDKIVAERKDVRIVRNHENLNFALGCNVGFAISECEYCIFLNSDTTVTDYWLDELIKPLRDPTVIAVQPKLVYPDNTIQCCGVVFSQWSCLGYPIYSGFDSANPVVNKGRAYKAVTAACMAVRSVDFARVNGFDPLFINGQEDIDLCLRLTSNGVSSCWYEPKALVYHYEGKSTGRGRYIKHNRRQFVARWGGAIVPDDLDYYNKDGYFVQQWGVDDASFTSEGIEIYLPVIQRQESELPAQSVGNEISFFVEYTFENWNSQGFPIDTYISGKILPKSDKLNILLCSHAAGNLLFGGERSFLDLLYALKLANLNVYVTIPKASNPDYLKNIIKNCCGVFSFEYTHWGRDQKPSLAAIARFQSIIDRNKISIVHVNTIMLREPLLAAKECGIPATIHVREIIQDDDHLVKAIGIPGDEIVGIVNSQCDMVIANSDLTARFFGRGDNVRVAKNVINTDEFNIHNEISGGVIKFGLISSNLPKKGIEDFYELAKKCHGVVKNAHFYLIGPLSGAHSSRAQQLKVEREQSGYPSNITFIDYKETPIEAISLVNVVLNLSHFSESFGRTICEAQAARRPVIVYNKGALPELVEHKFNGYIADYLNLEQVMEIICELCSNPSLIKELGENARQFVSSNFSHKRLSDQLVTIYNEVISRKKLNFPSGPVPQLARKIYQQARSFTDFNGSFADAPVSIIVPVYNAFEEFKNCIESVLKHTEFSNAELIIIDDCSTDPRVLSYIETLDNYCNIKCIRNNVNLGYTRTVNLGIKVANNNDVIFLNSDTVVTPTWLIGLRLAASAYPEAGTITAMSDNAGSFSFPKPGIANPIPKGMSQEEYAMRIVTGCLEFPPVELPTGSGFCMYVRRALINAIGEFDEAKFPRGYGEENDFCMRALKVGFKNYLTPWAFIFHVKTASFKEEREKLVNDGLRKLHKCYPDYETQVKYAFNSTNIRTLRERISSITEQLDINHCSNF